jgi:hypothetical protein
LPDSSGDLVNAWFTLFTLQQPGEAVPEALATWLDTAFNALEHQQPVLRVLASAASTRLRLSSLREWASAWSGVRYGSYRPDREKRIDLRERLMAMAEQSTDGNLSELNPSNRDVSMREDL